MCPFSPPLFLSVQEQKAEQVARGAAKRSARQRQSDQRQELARLLTVAPDGDESRGGTQTLISVRVQQEKMWLLMRHLLL